MKPIELDFQRIRQFRGSRETGFEELCSQLAALEPRSTGAIFYQKGSSADAGVECFLRDGAGNETGWQAKYFTEFKSSQVAQLNKSIASALAKHPQLDRYIVCLPIDLADERVAIQAATRSGVSS